MGEEKQTLHIPTHTHTYTSIQYIYIAMRYILIYEMNDEGFCKYEYLLPV